MNQTATPATQLTPLLLVFITIGAGFTIATVYFNQPILGQLMASFGLTLQQVALIPFMSQMGYALGILFVSPLGDRFERRALVCGTLLLLVASLVATALSTTFYGLIAASLASGLFASATQQLVPMAVVLAAPEQRGKVIGIVTAGILTGILLARTFSGFVSEQYGWPFMYLLAAVLILALALILLVSLPKVPNQLTLTYLGLLKSTWQLLQSLPILRASSLVQALLFSAFMSFWVNLALLLADLGSTIVGLFGIIGLVGVLAANRVGKLADRKIGQGPPALVSVGVLIALLAFGLMWLGNGSIWSLIVGIALFEVGLITAQVSNQAIIYALAPAARSRLNTVFMTSMFVGGAVGTVISGYVFAAYGWRGVCLYGLSTIALAYVVARYNQRQIH